jgi:HK97 family phage major capsid protein/HK97 family phage prohead protease
MDRYQFETKFSTTDEGNVHAIAWPYGQPDRVGDIIVKGAVSTERDRLPMLWSHDQRDVVGVWESLEERDDGLHVKGRLLLDSVPRAREVHALLKAGAVNGVSIGFTTKKSAKRKDGGRNINSLNLHEVSIVAVPMHPGARVVSVKQGATSEVHMSEDHTEVVPMDEAAVSAIVTKSLEPLAGLPDWLTKFTARLDKIEAKVNRPAVITKDVNEPSDEMKAFSSYLRNRGRLTELEAKTMIVGSDVSGGYLAPPEFNAEFIRNLVQVSPIRSLASVRTTANPSVIYPSRTAVTTAAWRGEAATSAETEPTFGQLEIPVREANCYVDVSNQLLADSGGTAEAEVRQALAENFGQLEGLAFVSGDGVVAPTGLLTDTSMSYTANVNTSTIQADQMITLFYALPALYRNRGTWIMNSKSLAQVRQITNISGNRRLLLGSLS